MEAVYRAFQISTPLELEIVRQLPALKYCLYRGKTESKASCISSDFWLRIQ